jgi:hypothetical protein
MDTYKGDRADLSLKNNFKPTFKLTYDKFIPNLVEIYPGKIFSIRVDKMEADDIIAVICKHLEKVKIKIVLYDKGKIYERYIYNNSNIVIRSSTYYWSNSLHILKCQTPILTTTKKRKKLRV